MVVALCHMMSVLSSALVGLRLEAGGGAALAGKIHRKPGDSAEPGVTVPLGLRSRGASPPRPSPRPP
eukprot:8252825-Lingulodinium_polyedra.AAC.1